MPREVGDWTRDKLKILEDYLPIYLLATMSAKDRIYIDAFAGPGTNVVKDTNLVVDGSPLIALKARARNGTGFSHLFFIEKIPALADELRRTMAPWNSDNRCEVITGDVNVELPRIVRRIHPKAPTLVFIDPQGIDPAWTTIEAIAPWKTELLVLFPLGMGIKRNLESPKVTAYYGTDEWEALVDQGAGDRALLDLYKGRLKALGYTYTTPIDRLVRTRTGQQLYYLVFVSKVPVAKRIMTWVFQQPDATGQSRMRLDA